MNIETNITENAKTDWLELVKKHKRRQRGIPALTTLNTNAGNVEHNISVFNKAASGATVEVSPVSGPFVAAGDSVGGLGESFAIESENGNITLYYDNIEITEYGPKRDADDWDEWDHIIDWEYKVDKEDVIQFIVENCLTTEDMPDLAEASAEDCETFVLSHFDELFEKYEEDILENWEPDATEDAQANFTDWDSLHPELWDYPEDPFNEELDDSFDMSTRTLL